LHRPTHTQRPKMVARGFQYLSAAQPTRRLQRLTTHGQLHAVAPAYTHPTHTKWLLAGSIGSQHHPSRGETKSNYWLPVAPLGGSPLHMPRQYLWCTVQHEHGSFYEDHHLHTKLKPDLATFALLTDRWTTTKPNDQLAGGVEDRSHPHDLRCARTNNPTSQTRRTEDGRRKQLHLTCLWLL